MNKPLSDLMDALEAYAEGTSLRAWLGEDGSVYITEQTICEVDAVAGPVSCEATGEPDEDDTSSESMDYARGILRALMVDAREAHREVSRRLPSLKEGAFFEETW